VVTETDLKLGDGRTLHAYDTGADDADGRLAVFWHHGSPNIGAPPEPLFSAADRLGIRWVSYDRPGYGGSTPRPDRNVASAAGDACAVADALSIERFAVMGPSAELWLRPDAGHISVLGSGAAALSWLREHADRG
jgi:pimeloyl-ACP methyl ester carboxylesterase